MSTCNFAYENRCIVVTNDDYEMDNLPPMGEWINGNRSYPSRKLAVSDDFNFFDVVITSGYYQDACIDYIRNEQTAEYFLGDTMYCKNYDEWIESAYDKITEYLADNEERKVNEYLDGVKKLYGYGELRCAGVFSNGEGIYEKVG